jgi:hypothetical protein
MLEAAWLLRSMLHLAQDDVAMGHERHDVD